MTKRYPEKKKHHQKKGLKVFINPAFPDPHFQRVEEIQQTIYRQRKLVKLVCDERDSQTT